MTSRERVLAALARKEPDRVPLDLGGTTASTLTLGACRKLHRLLGVAGEHQPEFVSYRAATVLPHDDVFERFSLDVRLVVIGTPCATPERPQPNGEIVDSWGVVWTKPGDGHYIPTRGPLQHLDDPGPADLARIAWPDPNDPGWLSGLRERAASQRAKGNPAVVLGLPVGPVHLGQFLRGFGGWLEDVASRPAFVEALMERILEPWILVATRALREAGDLVDVVMFSDDICTQRGPLVRPEAYRQLIKPVHQRMIGSMKRFGKPVLYHCCGSTVSLLPDFIECGADAINPVQVAAAGMDTRELKRRFGRDIAFWGAIDTQRVLPLGTVAEVRDEVRRRIDDLAPGGGYIMSAVHNVQDDVPPENVVAMLEAGREFGGSYRGDSGISKVSPDCRS
jgi:uroporphyrinogen decarboxylase